MNEVLSYCVTTPGGWLVVAVPGRALLLEQPSGTPFDAARLLGALRGADPIPAALELLAAGGFAAMPAFALIEYRGQSGHYVVRGDVALQFDGPGGRRSASGRGVTTWSEQLVSGIDRFTASAGADAGGDTLPLVDGVAWSAHIEWRATLEQTDASSPRAEAPSAALPGQEPPAGPFAPATGPTELNEAGGAPARESAHVPHETLLPEATFARAPTPAVDEGTTSYDHLFGVTVMRNVEEAAVRPPEEDDDLAAGQSASGAPSGASDLRNAADAGDADAGDHDGLTLMSADIAELRRRAAGSAGTAGQASVPQAFAGTAGDPRFRLEISDGRSEALDRPVIVGRAPSANKVSGTELPRLVTVGGSDPDISRNHVRFSVEGGTVVITDLHSRNGTTITMPGRAPQRLREGEPTSALTGTVVDLGGGITITVAGAS